MVMKYIIVILLISFAYFTLAIKPQLDWNVHDKRVILKYSTDANPTTIEPLIQGDKIQYHISDENAGTLEVLQGGIQFKLTSSDVMQDGMLIVEAEEMLQAWWEAGLRLRVITSTKEFVIPPNPNPKQKRGGIAEQYFPQSHGQSFSKSHPESFSISEPSVSESQKTRISSSSPRPVPPQIEISATELSGKWPLPHVLKMPDQARAQKEVEAAFRRQNLREELKRIDIDLQKQSKLLASKTIKRSNMQPEFESKSLQDKQWKDGFHIAVDDVFHIYTAGPKTAPVWDYEYRVNAIYDNQFNIEVQLEVKQGYLAAAIVIYKNFFDLFNEWREGELIVWRSKFMKDFEHRQMKKRKDFVSPPTKAERAVRTEFFLQRMTEIAKEAKKQAKRDAKQQRTRRRKGAKVDYFDMYNDFNMDWNHDKNNDVINDQSMVVIPSKYTGHTYNGYENYVYHDNEYWIIIGEVMIFFACGFCCLCLILFTHLNHKYTRYETQTFTESHICISPIYK